MTVGAATIVGSSSKSSRSKREILSVVKCCSAKRISQLMFTFVRQQQFVLIKCSIGEITFSHLKIQEIIVVTVEMKVRRKYLINNNFQSLSGGTIARKMEKLDSSGS